ncbi:hypothetical protein [Weissella paramesenteroides]|jgi:hypothetical protein|uniref:hypothetical protein n=1 Tax=Weissella paramesenteroides TaxID=1249 RepID=UPI002E7C1E06|nr:hypothetical protein [Weissella paramesenteroides]WPQ67963.1 hypothetical protein QRX23_09510 [Weissella paramesenteroides]
MARISGLFSLIMAIAILNNFFVDNHPDIVRISLIIIIIVSLIGIFYIQKIFPKDN